MLGFPEKVKLKKERDRKLFDSSLRTIADAFGGKKGKRPQMNTEGGIAGEMARILQSFRMEPVAVPDGIREDEAKILYIMSVSGVTRRRITLAGRWWKEGATPLLCSRKDGEIVALLPQLSGGYAYYDVETGASRKMTGKLAAEFTDSAFCFYKPFPDKPMTVREFVTGLFRAFTPGDVVYLLVVSLAVGLLGLILPQINQMIFNKVIPSGTISDIWGISAVLIGVTIVSALFTLTRSAWILRVGNKIELYAQNAVWSRVFNLPAGFFKKYESGELTQRAASINTICSTLNSGVIPTILTSLFAFVYLFQISSFSGALLLPTVLIIVTMLGSAVLNSYLQIRYTDRYNAVNNKLSGLVYQLFSGVSKIKIAGAEIRAFSKWAKLYATQPLIPNLFLQISTAVNATISFGGTIALYVVAYNAGISSADYIAFNVAFGAFSGAILQLSGITQQIASLRPAMRMLSPILEAEPENDVNKKRVNKLSGRIEVNQVDFRYNPEMPLVLNELSLCIEPGDYVAIVGPSGCGKSTLFRLLLGFESPESGAVYYDMQDIDSLDMRSVRQRIGVVLQHSKLFSGDIYSNIVICAPWLSVKDAWKAAEKAGFADDIRAMPMGMYTMISEGGGGISGGQQQRLLIARALAANPDILMFDEATSALDNITQAIVVETLSKMDITRIVIAHRLSTIRNCSKIIYIDHGHVAEAGTYEELMEKDSLFAALAKRQLA